jgi:hypothetical protein
MRIYIDGTLWQQMTDDVQPNFRYWWVKPYTFNTTGTHHIRVEFYNSSGAASAAVEVYNNTFAELTSSSFDGSQAHILFSTANVLGTGRNLQVIRDVGGANIPKYTCSAGTYDPCNGLNCGSIPVNTVVNPYVAGYRGNWRAKESKVYQVNRKYNNLFNTEPLGVDVKNAGYFETFRPFYNYNYGNAKWAASTAKEWVTANTVTLYDKYGQELENKDALGRYSAAGFVFKGEMPGAVASNSKYREIYYETFEDYQFRSGCITANPNEVCNIPAFTINSGGGSILSQTTGSVSHSGNYSITLPASGILLTTVAHNQETKQTPYLTNNGNGEYATQFGTGIYPTGFEPQPGKKYVFNAWVKDGQPTTNTPGITLTVNGGSVPLTLKAVVEKWKQVEGIIDLTSLSPNTAVSLLVQPSGGTVYFDDLRIHPFDAHMKTYAYDDKTMRLMAEMDENNFATFYEYDDEGTLVRVKKETERGIMTIKENRSSYRRKQ